MRINKDKVLEAIKNTIEPIDNDTVEDVLHTVYVLKDTYLENDLEHLDITSVEKPVSWGKKGVGKNANIPLFEGTADAIATVRKESDFYPNDFRGKKLIIDWKTKDSATFDTRWVDDKRGSWQWRLYSMAEEATGFEYRGVSRASDATKRVVLRVPEYNKANCISYLNGIAGMLFILEPHPVWPRHKPYACNAYARPCPFLESCKNDEVPSNLVGQITAPPIHYTSAETFLLCPERYRLLTKLEEQSNNRVGEASRYTLFGGAVHRGIAEIYTQAYKLC